MPTYQYACTACGEPHEAVQSFTDAPLTDCPACHGRLRKVFSAVGVVFKGSGFYKNDSRGAAKGETGKADKADGGKSEGDGGKKADGAAAKTDGAATKSEASKSDSKPAKGAGSTGGSTPSTPAAKTA